MSQALRGESPFIPCAIVILLLAIAGSQILAGAPQSLVILNSGRAAVEVRLDGEQEALEVPGQAYVDLQLEHTLSGDQVLLVREAGGEGEETRHEVSLGTRPWLFAGDQRHRVQLIDVSGSGAVLCGDPAQLFFGAGLAELPLILGEVGQALRPVLGPPDAVWRQLSQAAIPTDQALAYLEHVVALRPDDPAWLALYAREVDPERGLAFLAPDEAGPVQVARERAYQQLAVRQGRGTELLASYRERAVKAGRDLGREAADRAGLAYLAARLEPKCADAIQGYRRAIELDPRLGWAHHGLATQLAGRGQPGDLAAALTAAERAFELLPGEPDVFDRRFRIQLAAGSEGLAGELAARRRRQPRDLDLFSRELERRVAEGQPDEQPRQLYEELEAALPEANSDDGRQARAELLQVAELLVLNAQSGDEARSRQRQLAQTCAQASARAIFGFRAAVELGDMEGAAQALAEHAPLAERPDYLLLQAIGWALGSEAERVEEFVERLVGAWGRGSPRQRRAARCLRETGDPRVLALTPELKRLLLALQAWRDPAQALVYRQALNELGPPLAFEARLLDRLRASPGPGAGPR